jgi:hypothetical protein
MTPDHPVRKTEMVVGEGVVGVSGNQANVSLDCPGIILGAEQVVSGRVTYFVLIGGASAYGYAAAHRGHEY